MDNNYRGAYKNAVVLVTGGGSVTDNVVLKRALAETIHSTRVRTT